MPPKRQNLLVTELGRLKLTVTNLLPSSRLICHLPLTYNSPDGLSNTELTADPSPSLASKVVNPCMAILITPPSVPSHRLPSLSSAIGPVMARAWSIG